MQRLICYKAYTSEKNKARHCPKRGKQKRSTSVNIMGRRRPRKRLKIGAIRYNWKDPGWLHEHANQFVYWFWTSMCQLCTRSPDHFIAHKSNYGQHAVYGVNAQHKNESLILFNYKCQRLAIARRNLITIWFWLSLVLVTTGPKPDQREITRLRSSPPLATL